MHGRIKVRTTLEQQEAKRKEREKKAALFQQGMKQVFENRYNEEKEIEVLKISEKLLSGNPDVATLWNIRKEILKRKMENCESEEERESLEKMFLAELQFLQNCLHVNPKSYAVFNQRVFVMKHMRHPKWNDELQLCDMFLKYDERNFHCWDYRRFIVKNNVNIKPEDELIFTMKKISDNFSNYSAWHNRSKLLPIVSPDQNINGKLDGNVLQKELELVQNAFFTDPNDQTAWIYHRWLLGRKDSPLKLLSVILQRNPSRIIISFSKAVNICEMKSNVFILNKQPIECKWKTSESFYDKHLRSTHSCIWITEYECKDDYIEFNMKLTDIPNVTDELTVCLNKKDNEAYIAWNKDTLMKEHIEFFSDSKVDVEQTVLERELTTCQELLEIEPDLKWIVLTIVYLMHAIDDKKYQHKINTYISQLVEIDPKRTGYYKDLRSKYCIERSIQKILTEKESIDIIDLTNQNLTSLYYAQYFTPCTELLLKGNHIPSISFMKQLPFTREITLDKSVDVVNQLELYKKSSSCSNLIFETSSENEITLKMNHLRVSEGASTL